MASTLNLAAIRTPGVYIDEMSLFPPSVAQVDTAVPAFIGLTETATRDGLDITGAATRIASMADYRAYFGGSPRRDVVVTLDSSNRVTGVGTPANTTPRYLHDSLMLYFANGGDKCYILSIGNYGSNPTQDDYVDALTSLEQYDEPTLIVMPDAVTLGTAADGTASYNAYSAAISHCQTMQDRFAILDVRMANPSLGQRDDADIDNFRNGVNGELNYAAAYYPYLETSIPQTVGFANLSLVGPSGAMQVDGLLQDGPGKGFATSAKNLVADTGALDAWVAKIKQDYTVPGATVAARKAALKAGLGGLSSAGTGTLLSVSPDSRTELDNYLTAGTPDGTIYSALVDDVNGAQSATIEGLFARVTSFMTVFKRRVETKLDAVEVSLKAASPVYASILAAAQSRGIVLPPSGAVAGAYAKNDTNRGVWKAPANISLNYVQSPKVLLSDREQEDLNVDVTAGKSINAIRAFTGKGTMIWGARTLAGLSTEWRFVSVRRFFIMVEESVKKATSQFVFEANDANTWVKARAMVENFLTLQWRAGALAGVKPEQAFFVRVGLGQTMTAQDVLEGRMIVEVGMAVVRPAEFLILRFSHKMQES